MHLKQEIFNTHKHWFRREARRQHYLFCLSGSEHLLLLGSNPMELVDVEVVGRQKELLIGTVKGVFRAK